MGVLYNRPGLPRGAYVGAAAEGGQPRLVLIATGSEVWVALEARDRLQADGIPTRVVSMPCWELFCDQDQSYRDQVLPPGVPARLAVEAATSFVLSLWVGEHGEVFSSDYLCASAPGSVVLEKFGFTPDNVADRARALLGRLDGKD
jgi:transketolase